METTLGSAAFRTQLFNPGDVENCKEVMAGCQGQRLGVPRPPDCPAHEDRFSSGEERLAEPFFHSPPGCALAIACGDFPPALAWAAGAFFARAANLQSTIRQSGVGNRQSIILNRQSVIADLQSVTVWASSAPKVHPQVDYLRRPECQAPALRRPNVTSLGTFRPESTIWCSKGRLS